MTDLEFKKALWDAANKLRGSVAAADYKYPVLGLVFMKYVSDLFDAQADVIRTRLADPPDGHPKLLHLWPVKLLQAGRPNYRRFGLAGSDFLSW